MSEAPPGSNRSLLLGLAAAVVLALGVGLLVYQRQGSSPPVPPATGAATETAFAPAEPAAPPADAAPPAAGAASAPGGPAPGAATPAKPPAAPGQRDKPELGGPRGAAGAPLPLSAQAMMRRRFVPNRTASENVKGPATKPAGFDAPKAQDVTLKRAPEVDGRIEFSASPTRVRPGDAYKVVVSFVNEGKRTVEVKEVVVTTTLNGSATSAAVKPLVKAVASNQNEAIYELTGSWDKATTSWAIEVQLTSGRRDLYRNSLVWK